jgi:hypothetical protein
MNRPISVLLISLVVSACVSPPPPRPTTSSASLPATSTSIPTRLPTEGLAACRGADLSLSTREFGAGMGTSYAPIHVVLVGPQPCLLPATPAAGIEDARRKVVAAGPAIGDAILVLRSRLDWRLAWSSWCGPSPVAPLWVMVSLMDRSSASTHLPRGFGASCEGVATTVFVEPIDPEDEIIPP